MKHYIFTDEELLNLNERLEDYAAIDVYRSYNDISVLDNIDIYDFLRFMKAFQTQYNENVFRNTY